MAKTAGILVIGNEILSGKTRDENSPYFARELRALGVDVRKIAAVPDELDEIAAETRMFSAAFDYVFTSGGVGPTHDDLTMEGIARAFGQRIVRHPELVPALHSLYAPELIEPNLRMADIPEGAHLIWNGLAFPVVAVRNVYIFPGVPEILRRKFARIMDMFREAPYQLREVYLREDEGRIAAPLHRVLERFPELLLGSYPYFDDRPYSIKLTLESKDRDYLDRATNLLVEELAKMRVTPLDL